MNDRRGWIATRVRLGWGSLAVGIAVIIAGVIAEMTITSSPYNLRIITGFGIMVTGVGVGVLVRYRAALRDELSARRLTAEERDERTMLIRMRAGNRAFWTSAALVYAGLMWSSSAANNGLPEPAGDALWYFLATATLVPFAVYIGSMLVDERAN